MACCAASMGIKVHMFFTFWGVTAIKKKNVYQNKTWLLKMLNWMLPGNAEQSKLSKLNMMGVGTWMLKDIMTKYHMKSLSELIETARDLDVEMTACTPSMQLFGIAADELIDDLKFCGCATFLLQTSNAHITWIV
jgi:peroxiredoxin family protein